MWIVILSLLTTLSWAQSSDFASWSERTLALRSEVEALAKRADEEAKANTAERESLRQRQLELTAAKRKEDQRSAQLAAKRDSLSKRLRLDERLPQDQKKDLLRWVTDLEAWVDGSLPFRRKERLQAVAEMKSRIERGEGYERLVADLWTLTEKELHLTRENIYEILNIDLDGTTTRAEVARAGMIQMAFVATDGRAGFGVKEPNGWKLRVATSSEEQAAARRMVQRFREHGGRGYFDIPLVKEAL